MDDDRQLMKPQSVAGLPILLQDPYLSIEAAKLQQDTINFERASSTGYGINLGDAYGGVTGALVRPDLPAFDVESMGVTSKITLRIQVRSHIEQHLDSGASHKYFRSSDSFRTPAKYPPFVQTGPRTPSRSASSQ